MAPKKKTSTSSHPSFPIGNCEVVVEAKKFTPESTQNSLQITLSKHVKIKISVVEGEKCRREDNDIPVSGTEEIGEYYFVLVNPKNSDDLTKSLIQEVLELYSKELPAMNFAANTGKESMFLEKCVSNGKYCTLLLKYKSSEQLGEVVSAITYQIVPSDTHYAEIPLAAVSSKFQKMGIGQLMYMELRKRLHRVGIRSIFCWGDQESEGFWLKQDFMVIGEVNKKGRARRLPIKADVRKALCFPGGSTLMISHLNDLSHSSERIKLLFPQKPPEKHHSSEIVVKYQPDCMGESTHHLEGERQLISCTGYSPAEKLAASRENDGLQDAYCSNLVECSNRELDLGISAEENVNKCLCSAQGARKRIWESSLTSMNSKKVKGSHAIECHHDPTVSLGGDDERKWCCNASSLSYGNKLLVGETDMNISSLEENYKEFTAVNAVSEDLGCCNIPSSVICFRVMLTNIADAKKKANLTKVIEDLGGNVTSDGSISTHVVTGKVRRTLNFCTALCSGAWIISPIWLKESFRNGRFVDEMPFVLKDEEYACKYRMELKVAVLRAKARPHSLLKGHDVCLAAHVQPSITTLTAVIKSAGGNVIRRLDEVKEPSSTIFIACEEDMEEALFADKKGIRTFSSEWLMNCILRQELDLEASQFAESL